MKKKFFASALVMGLLSACSNDDAVPSGAGSGSTDNGLMPIELNMKTPVSIVTRGMGTVGGMVDDAANNIWRGETLYFNMYMKKNKDGKDVLEVSTWPNVNESGVRKDVANFDNEPIRITSAKDAEDPTVAKVQWPDSKYYAPDASRHDFFAYRIDDATVDLDAQNRPVISNEVGASGEILLQKSVNFEIDGSQDLMVGQADPQASPDAYSAKSARAGLIPQIKMEHLLTRFTFEVKAGDESADGLEVKKIAVVSKSKGRMIVAWHPNSNPGTAGKIVWDENIEPVEMVLKQRPSAGGNPQYPTELEDMTPVTLAWDADKDANGQVVIPVGEALMVAPYSEEYKVHVTTSQPLDGGRTNTFVSEGTISIVERTSDFEQPTKAAALPGTSYKVTVKLYGLSKIELETKLTGWVSGENIEVDTATD